MFRNAIGKVLIGLTAMVFVSCTMVFGQAQAPVQAKAKAKPCCQMAKKGSGVCKGEVTSVDPATNTVSLKCKKYDCQVVLNDKTEITCGKDVKTIADLKPGARVIVHYNLKDGKNEATKVSIKPVAPASAEKKK